jgi:hypothetical protein
MTTARQLRVVPGRIVCPFARGVLAQAVRARKIAGQSIPPEEIERDFGCIREVCLAYHVTGQTKNENGEVVSTGDCAIHYAAVIGGVGIDLAVRTLQVVDQFTCAGGDLARAVPTALMQFFGDKPKAVEDQSDK